MTNQASVQSIGARVAYDAWHSSQEVDSEVDTPWHHFIEKHISPAEDLAGRSVLEIGCGRGGFSCWLASQHPAPREVVAADFSEAALEMGRAFATKQRLRNITWKVADIQQIPFDSETFDTVISCETIEHVPNPRIAVHELARVLRKGGRLFLTTPNYFGPFGPYRIYRRVIGRRFTEVGQPINKFVMLPITRRWVKSAGLRIQVFDSDELCVPFPGGPPLTIRPRQGLRFIQKWFGLQSGIVAKKY